MEEPRRRNARIGRPLSFDRDAALHEAMLLFWQHGYEATSLTALTKAMGVTPPSVYAAFGDKKRLFLEAIARYVAGPPTPETMIDAAATARDAAWDLLRSAAIGYTGADTPPGCLLASSAIACSSDAADVKDALSAIRRRIAVRLTAKIAAGVAAGELEPTADPAALAGLVTAVIQGMSTLARDGAGRDDLLRVAATAMSAWPAARLDQSRSTIRD